MAFRAAQEPARQADGIALPGRAWWLVVRYASAVAGAGMRTVPFAPCPPFLLPMPDQAALALARALHERGEEVLGLNGARPAVDLCAAELTRLGGGRVRVDFADGGIAGRAGRRLKG